MVPETGLDAFAVAHADGGCVIDVREPHEYAVGHVPGARLVPLAELPHRIAELPTDQPIYVICASGRRSRSAAQYLIRRGLDARSVSDGTAGWAAGGLPVARGGQQGSPSLPGGAVKDSRFRP